MYRNHQNKYKFKNKCPCVFSLLQLINFLKSYAPLRLIFCYCAFILISQNYIQYFPIHRKFGDIAKFTKTINSSCSQKFLAICLTNNPKIFLEISSIFITHISVTDFFVHFDCCNSYLFTF